jgi:hypothetical protein
MFIHASHFNDNPPCLYNWKDNSQPNPFSTYQGWRQLSPTGSVISGIATVKCSFFLPPIKWIQDVFFLLCVTLGHPDTVLWLTNHLSWHTTSALCLHLQATHFLYKQVPAL